MAIGRASAGWRPADQRETVHGRGYEERRFELSALANWPLSDGKNSLTPVPRDLCQMLMEVAWRLGVVPEVDGLFLAPTLRRDGSLLAAEGYDPATRLLLVDLPNGPVSHRANARGCGTGACAVDRATGGNGVCGGGGPSGGAIPHY